MYNKKSKKNCLSLNNKVVKNKMSEELEFISVDEIPNIRKSGRNWKKMFTAIPEGEALILTENDAKYPTIKNAVTNVNKKMQDGTVFKVSQRTIDKVKKFFIYRE